MVQRAQGSVLQWTGRRPVMRAAGGTVLVVDDAPASRDFLRARIEQCGCRVLCAENGQQALTVLAEHKETIDVVMMDYNMPVMDGLTAIRRIKDQPGMRSIPVVMVTSDNSPDLMRRGFEAGVFYFLCIVSDEPIFHSVLKAAMLEARQAQALAEELRRHRASFYLIDTCKFTLRTLQEAESLAAFMANCFPDPERALWGLGELLVNAIEHGNLGLGYQRKTDVMAQGIWLEEIQRMQALPENREKKATATVTHKPNGVYVVIEDEGEGFDWKRYLHIDPARAGDNHGRGIAQANAMSFDKLTFNEKGNIAVGFVSHESRLDW